MGAAMLIAVFIPAGAELHTALRTPGARQAIAAGFGLYLSANGRTALLPKRLPGWYRMAVKLRDLLQLDDEEVLTCAA